MCGCKRSESCCKAAWKALKANKNAFDGCIMSVIATIFSLIALCLGNYNGALFAIIVAVLFFAIAVTGMVSLMLAFLN